MGLVGGDEKELIDDDLRKDGSMSLISTLFLLLVYFAVGSAGVLTIAGFVLGPEIWQAAKKDVQERLEKFFTEPEEKGAGDMLPNHIKEKIMHIIEERTGVKLPLPKSVEEILSEMPRAERAKLQPILVPIVVDALREATGMDMDASLELREYLLGQSLGLTELDIAIETDAVKMEKTLAGRKRFKEIADSHRDELGDDPVANFVEKMFIFKLLTESFKDMQIPPGWSPQQVAGLLSSGVPDEEVDEPYEGEIIDDEV